jgi:hypothetical protein
MRITQAAIAKHVLPLRATISGPARRTLARTLLGRKSVGAGIERQRQARDLGRAPDRDGGISVFADHLDMDGTRVDTQLFAQQRTQA